jgi:bile acid-coenzyme A ligase
MRRVTSLPFGDLVRALAEEQPDATALSCDGRAITRRELDSRTNQRARRYERAGVTPGSVVVIVAPNSIGLMECAVATWKLGATPLVLPPAMPAAERIPILELAKPSLTLLPDSELTADQAWSQESPAPLGSRTAPCWRASTSGGSTGRPKLIYTRQPARTDPDLKTLRLRREGCLVIPGPLYHGAPFLFATFGLLRGKHVALLSKFSAERTLQRVAGDHADFLLLVPTMMNRIWKLPGEVRGRYDLSSLDVVLHLGASCPPALKRAWIGWLGAQRIHELYAGTEGQAMTWITGQEWLAHPGSVGRPVGGAQMRAFDTAHRPLPAGEIGEIFMQPPGGAEQAYSYAGATPRRHGRWESLGDVGWTDPDGYVYVLDRRSDMILSGGANVYPAEVEAALEAHPAVRAAVVIGLPDDDLGHRVHAVIEPAAGAAGSPTEQDLRDFLADRLVRYKTPRSFEFVDGPLRDEAGKVRRAQLAASRTPAQYAAAPQDS